MCLICCKLHGDEASDCACDGVRAIVYEIVLNSFPSLSTSRSLLNAYNYTHAADPHERITQKLLSCSMYTPDARKHSATRTTDGMGLQNANPLCARCALFLTSVWWFSCIGLTLTAREFSSQALACGWNSSTNKNILNECLRVQCGGVPFHHDNKRCFLGGRRKNSKNEDTCTKTDWGVPLVITSDNDGVACCALQAVLLVYLCVWCAVASATKCNLLCALCTCCARVYKLYKALCFWWSSLYWIQTKKPKLALRNTSAHETLK